MAISQTKVIGQGVLYALNATTIGQVKSITPMPENFDEVDATDLDDTIVTKLPSSPVNLGDVTIEMYWTPNADNDAAINTAMRARSQTASHVITYNNLVSATSKTHTFTGWIKSLTPGVIDGKTAMTRTIVITPNSTITES